MRALVLVLALGWAAAAAPDTAVAPPGGVPCRTIDDCWLDAGGQAIPRPRRLRKRPLPRGDCGGNLVWLRNRLSCDAGACTVLHVGDRC